MKHALVAIDFSERSVTAVRRAVTLAQAHGAKLTLCHCLDETLAGTLGERQRRAAEDALEAFLQEVESSLTLEFGSRLVSGPAWDGLLSEAETVGADLIIVGRHREHAWKEVFRGTTVDRLVRHARIPVLMAVADEVVDYQRVVVGMDFSLSAKQALSAAHALTPTVKLDVLHVQQESLSREPTLSTADVEEMLQSLMRERLPGVDFRSSVASGWPYRMFSQAAPNDGGKLLALGVHGRSGFVSAIVGGVTESCLATPFCDLLLVPAAA